MKKTELTQSKPYWWKAALYSKVAVSREQAIRLHKAGEQIIPNPMSSLDPIEYNRVKQEFHLTEKANSMLEMWTKHK